MIEQTIFDLLYPKFKIDKPIAGDSIVVNVLMAIFKEVL